MPNLASSAASFKTRLHRTLTAGLQGSFNHHHQQKGNVMYVHCTTCSEPWDTYHLRFDAIYETDLDTAKAKAWTELSSKLKLRDHYREKFKAVGFEFGSSVINVMRCPACPKYAKPDPDKAAMKASIVEVLDDEDGMASTMEDLGL